MDDLENLIPKSIIDQMELDRFDFNLNLTSTPCNNRWPTIKIIVDGETIFDNKVIEQQEIVYSNRFSKMDELKVDIEYYNKQDLDTTVDSTGQILENQSVTISNFLVNGIDLIKTQIIYNLGKFYQNLSLEKQQYFKDHGFETGPSHTLYLCENGTWKLTFKFPIMQHFVKTKTFQSSVEAWPDLLLLHKIYKLIQEIRCLKNTTHDKSG